MEKVAIKEQITQEYQKLCAELGQLTLQRMDLGEQLQKMDARILELRTDSHKLARSFTELTQKEASNVEPSL